MPFRNVTKIQFGTWFHRDNGRVDEPIDRNKIREKVLAHLISMTLQLKYLLVEQFEWLLHVVQYAFDELRRNALDTVLYAEFCLPSCHYGFNKANHIGKRLVPFLSRYMPHLQTLRLWRSDDFPWTSRNSTCKCLSTRSFSIGREIKRIYLYRYLWGNSLRKS
ncbi:unnamed protein product [Rotaria sordida]|uniref:Uncharacterized protein n=1 Tax=Rotaria sordida TaxID=392033 RepID=A0A814V6I4_9BILA|nr:unnamed protein product [Rotaria sordida]